MKEINEFIELFEFVQLNIEFKIEKKYPKTLNRSSYIYLQQFQIPDDIQPRLITIIIFSTSTSSYADQKFFKYRFVSRELSHCCWATSTTIPCFFSLSGHTKNQFLIQRILVGISGM